MNSSNSKNLQPKSLQMDDSSKIGQQTNDDYFVSCNRRPSNAVSLPDIASSDAAINTATIEGFTTKTKNRSVPWFAAAKSSSTNLGMQKQQQTSPSHFKIRAKLPSLPNSVQISVPHNMEARSSRRSRHFVPSNHKDEYYWVKRQKNNEAARKSREKRRMNDLMLEMKVFQLLQENIQLKKDLLAVKVKYNEIDPSDVKSLKKYMFDQDEMPGLYPGGSTEAVLADPPFDIQYIEEDACGSSHSPPIHDNEGNNGAFAIAPPSMAGPSHQPPEASAMDFTWDKQFQHGPAFSPSSKTVISCTTQDTVSAMIIKDEIAEPTGVVPFPRHSGATLGPKETLMLQNHKDHDISQRLASQGSQHDQEMRARWLTNEHLQVAGAMDPTHNCELLSQSQDQNACAINPAVTKAIRIQAPAMMNKIAQEPACTVKEDSECAQGPEVPGKDSWRVKLSSGDLAVKEAVQALASLCYQQRRDNQSTIADDRVRVNALCSIEKGCHGNETRNENDKMDSTSVDPEKLQMNHRTSLHLDSGRDVFGQTNDCQQRNNSEICGNERVKMRTDQTATTVSVPINNGENVPPFIEMYFNPQDNTPESRKSSTESLVSDSSGFESSGSLSPTPTSTMYETTETVPPEEKTHRLPYKLRFKLATSMSST